ncbi:MAG TPA: heavy-metal-associated domain-containing protein [Haliscomenobacter sp.]|uniref:heavy-metal-associated domain-containing protein n=1 Tax=Haliscomenobacter sp. TaxID=2717303 RepID=UPI002BFAF581|nr:heavy-metal-associated domain-containing protein [Haliscomenobacter sp.]HOY17623.1 heavy-metal-associated domain-containing protein [Haliscomenobacter sp.]
MKKIAFFLFSALFVHAAFAQTAADDKLKNSEFKVLGNCGMCKKTIEKAAVSAGATTANWDVKTDLLAVSFDAKKVSKDAIQKAVALAGYDNAGYKADDEAYNKLHGCCKYDRTGEAGGTKSCTADDPEKQ